MQEGEGAYYSLTVDLVKSVAGTLYVIARFDNPDDATKPLSHVQEVLINADRSMKAFIADRFGVKLL